LHDSNIDPEYDDQPDLSREQRRALIKTFLERLVASGPPSGEPDAREEAPPQGWDEPQEVSTEEFFEAWQKGPDALLEAVKKAKRLAQEQK
jgi:hypothetical protein